MKSKLKPLFLILLSFLLFSFVGNKHKNDLELKHLKGKVKLVTEYTYSVAKFKNKYQKYNLDCTMEFYYDTNGNLVYFFMPSDYNPSYNAEATYKHDSSDRLIEADGYTPYGGNYVIKYLYDSTGNETMENYVNSRITSKKKTTLIYDNNGKEIEEWIYHNDFIGKNKTIVYTSEADNLVEKIKYKFNENNDIIEENHFHPYDSSTNIVTYKFEKAKADTSQYYYVYYYNSIGELKFKKDYFPVLLDEYKNWVKRVQYSKDIPYLIIERTIEYYQ